MSCIWPNAVRCSLTATRLAWAALALVPVACVTDDAGLFPRFVPDVDSADGGAQRGGSGQGGDEGGVGGLGFPYPPYPEIPGITDAGSERDNGESADAGRSGLRPGAAAGCAVCPCSAPCVCSERFGSAEPVTGLAVAGDLFGPAFSADGSTLFFSAVSEDENIFSASRSVRGAAFAAAAPVANLDAGGTEEGTPFLSFDGLSLYFFSTRAGPGVQGDRDLWLAQRPAIGAEFSAPSVIPAVNGPDLEHLPRLSRDELTLAFVSGRASPNAGSNIWVAERASRAESFGPAVELPGVNTDAREEGFSLSPDGLTLYFASDRLVPLDMDLWRATRSDAASPFGPPEPLAALNTGAQELDPALSPDGSELFFASTRDGSAQLFRSVRLCTPQGP